MLYFGTTLYRPSARSYKPRPDKEVFQSIYQCQELPSMMVSMLLNKGSFLICKYRI